jgi:leader peptidase (prepilin peptidase)/N-methyltransferase
VLIALLIAASVIDLRTLRIPDLLNAAIVAAGLGATWLLQRSLADALVGAASGYIALFAINWAYRAMRGRDGVGLGDAKLLAGAGAWLGWSGLPFVVLIGSALALMYISLRRVLGRALQATDALAFGPFLSAGIIVVWFVQILR